MDRIDFVVDRHVVLVRWNIWHDYFRSRVCRCVELLPDEATQVLLRRREVGFKRLGRNEWVLLGREGMEWDEEDEVVLRVKVGDPFFGYYSEDVLPEVMVWRPGMGEQVVWEGRAKRLRWEYLFLLREGREDCPLVVKETEKRLTFGMAGKAELGGRKGVRMVSAEAVELREGYDYSLRLYERQAFGEKVVCKRLSWPVPGRFPEATEGCIREVVTLG